MLKGPSEDEDGTATRPIFSTYDNVFMGDGSLLTLNSGLSGTADLPSLHPSPVQIFQLWQIYLDNVHPLLKIFHAPTIQQKLLRSVNDLSSISPPMHALLFGIYSAAVMSMRDTTCLDNLTDDRATLAYRYQAATRYALPACEYLRSSDTTVLQAAVLTFVRISFCLALRTVYLNLHHETPDSLFGPLIACRALIIKYKQIAMTKIMDPRAILCMSATSERSARRNGFHLNTKGGHISPFETEMRRRVWWQLMVLQIQLAEKAAAGPSALSWDWHTALPLNVNESELHPEMKTEPLEHQLPTDMIFCLVRFEIACFVRQTWREVQNQVPDFGGSEFGSPSTPLADKLRAIDAFAQSLQARYLKNCDLNTPLHIMTRYYATYAISKWKISAYTTASQTDQSVDQKVTEERQESLMRVCVEAIEAYTACFTNPALERFNWFLTSSVPFLAYVHLLFNLRHRPAGELADRAWAVITTKTDVHGRPKWIWGLSPSREEPEDSAMQLAFANLTVKAWEAREAALRDKHPAQVPDLVIKMRDKLTIYRNKHAAANAAADMQPATQAFQEIPTHQTRPFTIGPDPRAAPSVSYGTLQAPVENIFIDNDLAIFDENTLLPGSSFWDHVEWN